MVKQPGSRLRKRFGQVLSFLSDAPVMGESSDTDAHDTEGRILRSLASSDLTGIILNIVGAYGSLVFPGHFGMIAAGVSGIGAILIFTSDATNSTHTAGYFFALGSWALLALSGLTTRVAIPTLLTAFWFGFETERQILAEMHDS
jgi:hypothetical protein